MIERELKRTSPEWPPISQIKTDGNIANINLNNSLVQTNNMQLEIKDETQQKTRESSAKLINVFKKNNKIEILNDNRNLEQETKF